MSMAATTKVDVAIAGAGLAGASLALALARRGVSVTVIDPGTFPRDKLCGEFLSPECWGVLDRLGLIDGIERGGYHAIRSVRVTTPRGREITARLVGPESPPGLGLSRATLDNLIMEQARKEGAEVRESTRAGGAIVEQGRVSGLIARHPIRGQESIHARVTIAADGRHSALVKQTGSTASRQGLRPRLLGMKRHFRLDDDHPAAEPRGTVGLHVVRGGYCGTCRVEGGLTNLCALVPESSVRNRHGDLDRAALEFLGQNPVVSRILADGVAIGDWKAVSGVRVEVSRPRLPGILYVGDCKGTVDPLGGQGMTMALLGAEAVLPFVLRALESGAAQSLQTEWASAWDKRFRRRVRLCRAFHQILTRPGVLDLASILGPTASRILAECFQWTRDPAFASG
jgi:menaquinone-9 beta-reductase